jgi:hypothetical protein
MASKTKATTSNPQEHPDAAYIKREDLGGVISKGMAVLYNTKPKNPVDFLAKWLLNYSHVEKVAVSFGEHEETVRELMDKFEY